MSEHNVPVKFTLYSGQETVSEFDFNFRRCTVAVIGSVPELGSWKQDTCKQAFPVDSGFYLHYEVEVMMPANTTVEWSWVIFNNTNERILKWDSVRRITHIGKLGGRLFTYWGQEVEVFHSATCGVEMFTEYHCTPGEVLVLTGREHQLGNWDPKKGIVASRQYPLESGRWKANIILQQHSHSRFKWVVVDAKSGATIRWEETPPRRIWVEEGDNMMQIECPWNSDYYVKNLDRFYEEVDGMKLLTLARKARKREKALSHAQIAKPIGHAQGERKQRQNRPGCIAAAKSVQLKVDRREHVMDDPLSSKSDQGMAGGVTQSLITLRKGPIGRVGQLVGLFNSRSRTTHIQEKEQMIKPSVFDVQNKASQNV